MKSKSILLIVQIVAWAVFLILPVFVFSTMEPIFQGGTLHSALIGILILHPALILFYYFNYNYLIPKFYFTQKYRLYFLLLLICLLTTISLMELDPGFNPFYNSALKASHWLFVFSVMLRFIMIFLLSLGIASYNRLKQAEEGKLKAELSYLKAQINPHFLFNTLNSIYALTVKKSDAAPESVTKLSAIMRYVITDAAQDFVALEKELTYTTAYIELEKLRITDKVQLTYSVSGDPRGKQIAPLIFIPFIENAFKYGVSTKDNSSINIFITMKDDSLSVSVKNTKIRENKTKTGLGIANAKKRLDLLYTGKYELSIRDEETEYQSELKLQLK
jgi:sensor histidine kinase YesM